MAPLSFAMIAMGTDRRGGSVLATMTSPLVRFSTRATPTTNKRSGSRHFDLQAQSAAPRRPHPRDVDASNTLLPGKLGVGFVVVLSAGDDADVEASLRQGKGHVRKKLSRGGVIRVKEAVEKNDPPMLRHRPSYCGTLGDWVAGVTPGGVVAGRASDVSGEGTGAAVVTDGSAG